MKFKPYLATSKKPVMILLSLSTAPAARADATMPFTRLFRLGDRLTDGGAYSGTNYAQGARINCD